jgi:hypothetical protein
MVKKNRCVQNLRLQVTFGIGMALLAGLTSVAQAQVYVGDASGSFAIGKYTTSGVTVNAALIPAPTHNATGLAASGTSLFVADSVNYVIAKYNKTDGTLVDGSFITSPNVTMPYGLTVAGPALYVANFGGNKIGKFNASTGAAVNTNLITGLSGPWAIAISGSTLYVSNFGGGKVGKYTTDGATVNDSLISVSSPTGIGVWGSYLYVMSANSILKYTTDGTLVDASFLTGLSSPTNLVISGDFLYVTCQGDNAVHKYSLATGTEVGNPLIANLSAPFAIAVEPPVPTPTPSPATPTVTVKGAKKITTSLATTTLKGTASASAAVVKVKVGKKPFKTAKGVSAWKFKAVLAPGKNQIVIQAFNSAGDASAPAKVLIIRK